MYFFQMWNVCRTILSFLTSFVYTSSAVWCRSPNRAMSRVSQKCASFLNGPSMVLVHRDVVVTECEAEPWKVWDLIIIMHYKHLLHNRSTLILMNNNTNKSIAIHRLRRLYKSKTITVSQLCLVDLCSP